MSASRALTSSLKASTVLLAGARGRELRPWVVKQQVSPFKYAVKIVVDDPDPSKFQTGAQASAAIYTDGGNRSLGGAARIFDPGAFVVELALSDAILRQTRKGRLCLCPAFVAIFAAPVGRSLVSGCGRR
jgi:hypothetical protein